jgi:hypothetical protein
MLGIDGLNIREMADPQAYASHPYPMLIPLRHFWHLYVNLVRLMPGW